MNAMNLCLYPNQTQRRLKFSRMTVTQKKRPTTAFPGNANQCVPLLEPSLLDLTKYYLGRVCDERKIRQQNMAGVHCKIFNFGRIQY